MVYRKRRRQGNNPDVKSLGPFCFGFNLLQTPKIPPFINSCAKTSQKWPIPVLFLKPSELAEYASFLKRNPKALNFKTSY